MQLCVYENEFFNSILVTVQALNNKYILIKIYRMIKITITL